MKSPHKKKAAIPDSNIRWGLFAKRDTALEISRGLRHVHSTQLKENDASLKLTLKYLETGLVPHYPWEPTEKTKTVTISSSTDRSRAIKKAVTDAGLLSKRDLREKTEGVIEELITNGIYHAYQNPSGKEKYVRAKAVQLTDKEKLTLTYHKALGGIYLSISDRGGSLRFAQIAAALCRCYGHQAEQIETKESGAGLGLYLIFEAVTHLKIVTQPGEATTISCWIADKSALDPSIFSFNYFEIKGN